MPAVERSELHVEGRDDVHVVKHLLLRHRIDCPLERDPRPALEFAPNVPEIRRAHDRNAVLDSIEPAVRVSNGRSVGFLLDSDGEPRDRWRAVCDRRSPEGCSARVARVAESAWTALRYGGQGGVLPRRQPRRPGLRRLVQARLPVATDERSGYCRLPTVNSSPATGTRARPVRPAFAGYRRSGGCAPARVRGRNRTA